MKKLYFLKTMLLLCALVAGSAGVWAATTYKLTQVTSVSAGNKYVFEQGGYVMNNSVSSSALQCTNSYNTTGLTGTESYIWTLEAATNGYYMKNVSLSSSQYLNNSSKTNVSFGSKSSIWAFNFQTDNTVQIQNKNNSDRFLGFTNSTDHAYKAYATSNLEDYSHAIKVYLLEEEVDVTSLAITAAPTKTRYEVGENLDMTGFELDADGTSVTSGYTMTIGGTAIEDGDALNTAGKKTIVVSYGGQTVNQEISVGAVTGLTVTTAPTKTVYEVGETFDPTGMVVTAALSTGEDVEPDTWNKVVTTYTYPTTAFAGSETYVTISYGGQSVNQPITVNAIHVTGVTLNKSSLSILYGETDDTLVPTISPNNASDKSVSWSSDNEDVATVDENGVVTAKAVGTATITVTTTDSGKTATCVVTVTANSEKPSLVETIFEETFANVTNSSEASSNTGNYDNEGWTIDGSVYDLNGYVRMAKGKGPGSLTTPIITNLRNGATLSFKARGWDSDETSFSLEGTNCTLSSTTITGLPYGDSEDFAERTITINNVGDNPQITFSTTTGVRIYLDDIVITQSRTTIPVTLAASGFASYCSPFALDLTPTEDYAAYTVSSTSDATVTFTKITGKVAAQTPFILYNSAKGGETVNLPIIEDDDEGIASVGTNMLRGTLSPTYVTTVNGSYTNFGLSGGKFVKVSDGVVKANKAYLPILTSNLPAAGGARMSIVFEDESTGISSMHNSQCIMHNEVYDLQGRRVESSIFNSQSSILKKGLYIVNGKKVIK